MSTATERDICTLPIFELSDDELWQRLQPTYEAMKAEKFAKGGYITYYDPVVCPTSAHVLHEYKNKRILMLVNPDGKETVVKIL